MARYIAKLKKGEGVKFISHLDLMRCMQRAIRRSKVPISYSKGFNPHADMSFATPVSVGTASEGEYMDFMLEFEMDENSIAEAVNRSLPDDIRILWVKRIDEKLPSLMSMVDAASYEITIINPQPKLIIQKSIDSFLNRPSIEVMKESKKGEKLVDIKPMIYDIRLKSNDGPISVIETTIKAGSRSNLNPELLFNAMQLYMGLKDSRIRDITKKETYTEESGKFKNLWL
ncbi:MAG TPA: radical SAM protein [Clostridiaceae bacterium]|nr:radical SAM protein [Clostridiaceae bacterium]